jgi:hypothetical protein
VLWSQDYPTTPQAVKGVLFGSDQAFWKQHHAAYKFINPTITPWGGGKRQITYTMPPKGMQGKTWVEGVETVVSDTPEMVVIAIKTQTPKVPYGSAFFTQVHTHS